MYKGIPEDVQRVYGQMKKNIAVFGTFDTKGSEFTQLIKYLEREDLQVVLIDVSTKGEGPFAADFPTAAVLARAGVSREQFSLMEKNECLLVMANGTKRIISEAIKDGKVHGVISIGGGQGAFVAGEVMRGLPVGFPKMIVSTTVMLHTSSSHYLDINDTVVMNSLVDISGVNPILDMVIRNAAGAIAGMIKIADTGKHDADAAPTVAISMWGVTTPCVTKMNDVLEGNGYQTYIFHANGYGGRMMENLAGNLLFDGLADITMSELTIPLAGGEGDPIPFRYMKAGDTGTPRVVAPGGIDMVLFTPPFNVPDRFKNRPFYMHNNNLMFIRSSVEENRLFADEAARRLNASKGPVKVLLPLRGVSAVDIEGNVMFDPEADQVFFDCIKEKLDKRIEVLEVDCNINDAEFAEAAAKTLMEMLEKK